jgi:hypothetical protein
MGNQISNGDSDVWALDSQYASLQLFAYYFNNITCMSDCRRGFGLDIGFIDHFGTQLVITLNYSTIADFHTLQVFSSQQCLH